MSSLTVRDYHIGWICALEDEMAAAMAMLDEEHPMIADQDRQDHNSYVLGKIHQHHVVIACMPAGVDGLAPAAVVAKDMARTFPELRVGLMVGIGGGIPNLAQGVDIRLGDVVVSMPDKTWGGVVQYDHGKAEEGGVFRIKGQLNQPPDFLLRTLAQVQARHRMRPSKMAEYIAEAVAKNSMLEDNVFVRPEAPDELRCSACSKRVDDTAGSCDGWHQQRRQRKSLASVIHHGIIASGDVVVKDAVLRDRLRDQFSALCVEMEAAGLMNDFPCLVIRGICDYADRHKNDGWHAYAAMTAAAYAKEFLFYMSPAQASQERPIREIVAGILNEVQQATQAQAYALQAQVQYFENDDLRRCHQAFKTSNYEEQKDINPDRMEGTCQWVLTHEQYRRWHHSGGSGLLWISADPGCGKSVLAKSLVDHELRGSSRHSVCYFFFKDNEEQDSVATALCAILHQLLAQQPKLIRHALAIYDPDKPEKVQQDVAQLWRTLLAAASDTDAHDVTCVLDALDECQPRDRGKVIDMLARFHREAESQISTAHTARLKFLVTSRPYDDIRNDFERRLRDLPAIRLRGEEENEQIRAEIDVMIKICVRELSLNLRLSKIVRDQLQDKLLGMTHRTYLWLYLALDHIKEALRNSRRPPLESVGQLPSSVEDAYEKILGRISGTNRANARDILQIVVSSRRPLTVREMAIAFGIADSHSQGVTSMQEARLDAQWVQASLRWWCGLFIFLNHDRIYLIHQTAKEFLLADTRVCHPPSGWEHSIDRREADKLLAEICVTYLLSPEIHTSLNESKSATLASQVDTKEEFDFLDYATSHWSNHAQTISREDPIWGTKVAMLESFARRESLHDDGGNGLVNIFPALRAATNDYIQHSDSGYGTSIPLDAKPGTQASGPSEGQKSALGDTFKRHQAQAPNLEVNPDAIQSVKPSLEDIQSLVEIPMRSEIETAERYISENLLGRAAFLELAEQLYTVDRSESFVYDLRDLLKYFCVDLTAAAGTKLEHAVCRLLARRSYRERLARTVRRQVSPVDVLDLEEEVEEDFRAPTGRSIRDLELWLASDEQFDDPQEPIPTTEPDQSLDLNMPWPIDDDIEEAEDDFTKEHQQIKSAEAFIFEGQPFKMLLERLSLHAITPRYSALCRMLLSLPNENITISYRANRSLSSRLQCMVERQTGYHWDWWPLLTPSRALPPNMARISWICHCGTPHEQQLPVDAVQRFEHLFRRRQSKPTKDHLCYGRTPQRQSVNRIYGAVCMQLRSFKDSLLRTSGILKRGASSSADRGIGSGSSDQFSGPGAALANSTGFWRYSSGFKIQFVRGIRSISNRGNKIDVQQKQARDHRLILGLRGQRAPLEVTMLDTTRANEEHDGHLVRKIFARHRQRRGWIKSYFSIFRLRYFEYRKFEVYPPIRYRPCEASWPESKPDYVYGDGKHDPPSIDDRPPMPFEERRDALNRCSNPCLLWLLPLHDCIPELKTNRLYEHVPKKRTSWEVCDNDKSQAWGIQCFYEPSLMFAAFYFLMIFAGPFAFWGWWCSIKSWDLQNASAPATFAASLLALCWAAFGPLQSPRQSALGAGQSSQDRAEAGTGGFTR